MPWQKGQSGNPRGRKTAGEALCEQIRRAITPEDRAKMFAQLRLLACEPHGDPHARIKAAEWIAKHGWPEEARGQTTVTTDGRTTTVTHVYITAPDA
jgi:hypothetical protein